MRYANHYHHYKITKDQGSPSTTGLLKKCIHCQKKRRFYNKAANKTRERMDATGCLVIDVKMVHSQSPVPVISASRTLMEQIRQEAVYL